jgi:hypothetical protein
VWSWWESGVVFIAIANANVKRAEQGRAEQKQTESINLGRFRQCTRRSVASQAGLSGVRCWFRLSLVAVLAGAGSVLVSGLFCPG